MPCFTCIESAKLPFEYEGDEGDSKMDSGDDNNDPLTELMASVSQRRLVGYMRGIYLVFKIYLKTFLTKKLIAILIIKRIKYQKLCTLTFI